MQVILQKQITKRNFASIKTGKQKLAILGSGYAGYLFARNVNKSIFDVTVISPRNHFLFTP